MNTIGKIAVAAIGVLVASIGWHFFMGGRIVAIGQAESPFGNVWKWQVSRIGTDYAVSIIMPAGEVVSMGVFDTKDQAIGYAQEEVLRLSKRDGGLPPKIKSVPMATSPTPGTMPMHTSQVAEANPMPSPTISGPTLWK